MTTPPPRRPWWKKKRTWAAAVPWLVVATYIAGYVGTMRQGRFAIGSGPFVLDCRAAVYPLPGLSTFFGPAEWLDRKLRREYWRHAPPRPASWVASNPGRRKPVEPTRGKWRGVWPAARTAEGELPTSD